jgi:hypothetical protein
MRTLKTKNRIIVTVVISAILTSFTIYQNQDASIKGTWISENDNSYKMVFSGSNCTWLYTGQPSTTYSFTVSNTSPQCGEVVPVGNDYLKLVNLNDNNDIMCYEIYGLSETTLTLRPIDKSGVLVFNRQH